MTASKKKAAPTAKKAAPKKTTRRKAATVDNTTPKVQEVESIAHGPEPKVPLAAKRSRSKKPDALASKAPAAAAGKQGLKVFQVFTEAWQKDLLDPAFVALDQTRPASELAELGLPALLSQHAATQNCQWWGLASWRFTQLSGLTGQDLLRSVAQFPQHNVYWVQHQADQEGLFHNGWTQLETEHPGLFDLATQLFKAAGLNVQSLIAIHKSTDFFAQGCIMGDQAFWRVYNEWAQKLVSASNKLDAEAKKQLYEMRVDEKSLMGRTNRLGLIIQACVPLMIKNTPSLKAQKITVAGHERELNVHQQLLKEMKDVAHRTQSSWLAACWVNYRNLYLNQTLGKAWSQKFLRHITPTEIRFD
jgi:hypothetical protein